MKMSEPIIRPNGKPYRRRAPLRVREYIDIDYMTCIAVFGTHDPEKAREVARDNLGDLDLNPDICELTWWRLVPWDAHATACDSSYIHDPEKGQPAVLFGEVLQ